MTKPLGRDSPFQGGPQRDMVVPVGEGGGGIVVREGIWGHHRVWDASYKKRQEASPLQMLSCPTLRSALKGSKLTAICGEYNKFELLSAFRMEFSVSDNWLCGNVGRGIVSRALGSTLESLPVEDLTDSASQMRHTASRDTHFVACS